MFGNLAEMAGLMKKAKDLQGNLKNIKAELAEAEFTDVTNKPIAMPEEIPAGAATTTPPAREPGQDDEPPMSEENKEYLSKL